MSYEAHQKQMTKY